MVGINVLALANNYFKQTVRYSGDPKQMNKPYTRATPIGYNTGKVMIGGHYIPKPKEMTSSELFMQGLVLGRGVEGTDLLSTIISQVRAKVRLFKQRG